MKKPRHLSSDERTLWDSVARQTVPLVADPKPKPIAEAPRAETPLRTSVIAPFQLGENSASAPEALRQRETGKPVIKMDASAFAKMKRGKISPERRIDLHGMTLAQAHPALIRFILDAHSDQKRLVLVITGKGDRKDPKGPFEMQRGVLRRQVPMWLNAPPLNGVILQSTPSHQRHGGDGAIYVYLKRRR